LITLKRFLANEWDKTLRLKRGGGVQVLSFNQEDGETRYLADPGHQFTPEKAFERQWALTLLDEVLKQLQSEMAARGKAKVFEELKIYLLGAKAETSYVQAATKIGMTEGNVRVTVNRMRNSFKKLLRAEIANTVATPQDVDEEIRHLFKVLS